MRRTISSIAGGVVATAVCGGRVNVAQVAVDAFGNALGNSFASQQDAASPLSFAQDRAAREAANYWNPEQAGVSNSTDPLAGIDMQSILNNSERFAANSSTQNPLRSGEGRGKIMSDAGLGTTPILDALGNVTGVEMDATDDRPTLRYGDQMRKVAGFTTTFGKNVVLGVAQGGIGFVSDVGKGWGMIGDMLVNGGRNIGQLDQFNLRPFQYDEGVGQFGGVLGEMASPAAYVKGAQLGVSGLRAMGPTFDSALYNYMQRTGGLLNAASDVGGVNVRPNYLTPSEFVELSKTGVIDPRTIRYSQNSAADAFKLPYGKVDDFIQSLRIGEINPATISSVRIFQHDGKIFTLDNRRLYSFEQAGTDIPYQKLDAIPKRELFKFTTTNDGTSIIIRKGK